MKISGISGTPKLGEITGESRPSDVAEPKLCIYSIFFALPASASRRLAGTMTPPPPPEIEVVAVADPFYFVIHLRLLVHSVAKVSILLSLKLTLRNF